MQQSSTLERIEGVERAIEEAVEKYGQAALYFSGGMESCLLLQLAEPWRDKITVYVISTGAEFPHMAQFIERKLIGWRHRIIQRNLLASFAELGLPASVLPIEHTQGFSDVLNSSERLPRITPWNLCCQRNRGNAEEAIVADGIYVAIQGQRSGDYSRLSPTRPGTYSLGEPDKPHFEMRTPLWDWSRSEVREAIAALNVELPDHYREHADSLDCSLCPASLTSHRRAWMATRYPEHLAAAEKLEAEIKDAVFAALDPDNTARARDEQHK